MAIKIKKLLMIIFLGSALAHANFVSMTNYTLDSLSDAKSIEIMTYTMPSVHNADIEATALVVFPKTEKPKDGWRLVVWGHGTVGVADSCAPSLTRLNPGFRLIADNLLKDGYVIIAPDYEGLGVDGIHPYLNLSSEAKSIIYAVKALQNKYQSDFQGDWMVVGQSQGGQAALGVAEYADDDPTFKGSVAGAPASSLNKIIQVIAPVALSQIEEKETANNVPLETRFSIYSYATLLSYGTFIGLGIQSEYPDFDYESLFLEPARSVVQHVSSAPENIGLCLGPLRRLFMEDIVQYLQNNPNAKVMSYPGLDMESFKDNPVLQEFFVKNQPGTKKLSKPILIIQGDKDTNVPLIVTEELVTELVDLGSSNITLSKVPDAFHRDAIMWRNDELVAFIKKYMPAK